MKGEKLKDHLLAYRQAGALIPSNITVRTAVDQIRAALEVASDEFHAGKWKPEEHADSDESSDDSSSEEDFDLGDDESGWEDVD